MESVYNFKRVITNGVTSPMLVTLQNGSPFVIKFIHDTCNSKILFNELISYRLAKLLDIPIPAAKLLKLKEDFINANFPFQEMNARPCTCFGSEYVKSMADVSPVFVNAAVNKEDIPSIILFDQIIMNEDRSENPGNLLFTQKQRKLVTIDHSHVFRNGMIWDSGLLNTMASNSPIVIKNLDGKLYKILGQFVNGHSPFAKISRKINSITADDIFHLFDNIPEDWDITAAETESVKNLIQAQIYNIDGIMKMLEPHFPSWKGA